MENLTPGQVRMLRKKTQKECADALNIHVSISRRLEKNPSDFTVEQARKLCEFLGIAYNDVFFS